jgi:hypothetical protein
MQWKVKIAFPALLFVSLTVSAQLKFIIEDFEGLCDGTAHLTKNGIFDYGNSSAEITSELEQSKPFYVQDRSLKIKKTGKENFGGWGKGISLNVELDPDLDYLNFYLLCDKDCHLKMTLQEDDNRSNTFEKESDDNWICRITTKGDAGWKLISVPLKKFDDDNDGGDGKFNCTYKEGKLLCFIISNEEQFEDEFSASFDMICFSEGELTEPKESRSLCGLGLWSEEGNKADFSGIATTYEKLFGAKPLVIHLFQSFSSDGGQTHNINSSVDGIERLIADGYIPMITIEDHYVDPSGLRKNTVQPNLYSIIEGHFDFFFTQWARKIKDLNGPVLVRILHEFNGDWYPWCIVNNDKDPKLFIKAYRHIRNIFAEENVTNARFIWCPNSMSVPQEPWNFILDTYPGDEYVDIIGCDIYNGSGNNSDNWRSFRREAIENYFLASKYYSDKPFMVCETASRERKIGEGKAQGKDEWIQQMSIALKTDLSETQLLNWFNEKPPFKLNSSPSAKEAFFKFVVKDLHFKVDVPEIVHQLK